MTGPQDPITVMVEAMASLREVYESALAAGFTEDQAMRIVTTMVASGMQGPSS